MRILSLTIFRQNTLSLNEFDVLFALNLVLFTLVLVGFWICAEISVSDYTSLVSIVTESNKCLPIFPPKKLMFYYLPDLRTKQYIIIIT